MPVHVPLHAAQDRLAVIIRMRRKAFGGIDRLAQLCGDLRRIRGKPSVCFELQDCVFKRFVPGIVDFDDAATDRDLSAGIVALADQGSRKQRVAGVVRFAVDGKGRRRVEPPGLGTEIIRRLADAQLQLHGAQQGVEGRMVSLSGFRGAAEAGSADIEQSRVLRRWLVCRLECKDNCNRRYIELSMV